MDLSLTRITCYKCHVPFWVTAPHQAKLVDTHESFWCPNGHSQSYQGETDSEKYQRLYSQEQKRLVLCRESSERLQRMISSYRGLLTKAKKRGIAKGRKNDSIRKRPSR